MDIGQLRNSETLREDILRLESELNDMKKALFLHRFFKIIGTSSVNITNVVIKTDVETDTWYITYIHKTPNYNVLNYLYEKTDDTYDANETINKTSKIIFGVHIINNGTTKYFIKGGAALDLYKTSTNELRIINMEYQYDIDYDEQKELIIAYSENVDIPEFAAIKFMLFMSDNDWDDTSVINHFTMI
jgi:hypothetical protein